MNELFITAIRKKLRFDTPKGMATVEDLWDLPLSGKAGSANLDDIARGLFRNLKESDEISFVTPAGGKDSTVQMKFDIVKHIIETKIAERDAAKLAADRSARKQQLLSLIAQKESQALENLDLEELRKMAEEL